MPGYENRYEISSHGRIRSLGFYSNNRWGTRTWRAGRILKGATIAPHGYRGVTLVDADGAHTLAKIHRLVLLTFVGEPPPDRPNALHHDDNPANNRVENLYWGTHSQNSHDSVVNGSHVQARKDTCDLGHRLVEPNLVPSTTNAGGRSCLACKMALANHNHDAKLHAQGRERTRYNRGKDGFQRRRGESWQDEAHRRYHHIMSGHAFGLL